MLNFDLLLARVAGVVAAEKKINTVEVVVFQNLYASPVRVILRDDNAHTVRAR